MKARRDAWAAANRERMRAHARAYYHRHKQERRAASRAQNDRRREDPEYRAKEAEYRSSRRAVLNEQQNIQRRVDRRLHQLGLPPRPRHHWTVDEQIEMDRSLAKEAKRRWSKKDLAKLEEERILVRGAAYWASEDRWRERLETQIRADAERPQRLRALADRFLATADGKKLLEEIRMDVIALKLRGAAAYPDLAAEARRRAIDVLTERAAALPSVEPGEPRAADHRGLSAA